MNFRRRKLSLLLIVVVAAACSETSVTQPGITRSSASVSPVAATATLTPTSGPAGTHVRLTVTGVFVPCPGCGAKTPFGPIFPDGTGYGVLDYVIPQGTPIGPWDIWVNNNGVIEATAVFTVTDAPTCDQLLASLVARLNAIVDASGISASRKASLHAAIALLPAKVAALTPAQKQMQIRIANSFISTINNLAARGSIPPSLAAELVDVANQLIKVLTTC